MKDKNLRQFQNLVLRRIIAHIKSHTLLNAQEIRKIFSPQKLYGSSLYSLLFHQDKKNLSQELLDPLTIMEILIKANSLHQTIEEIDLPFLSPTLVPGEPTTLLKNTRKILLGDMLIATAINTINSLADKKIQKAFHSRAQETFLGNIERILEKNPKSQKKPRIPQNWIILFPLLTNKRSKDKGDNDISKQKVKAITDLLSESLHSPEPGRMEKKIMRLEKVLAHKRLSPKEIESLILWLRKEVLYMIPPEKNKKNQTLLKKDNSHQNKKTVISQLLF